MPDVIDRLFNSNGKKGIAREILHKLRIRRATRNFPKTVQQIKAWFSSNQSTVESAAKKLAQTNRSGIPVETKGNWKNGNQSNDGLYITDQNEAKELAKGPLDVSHL
jgi:hypothetical protein